MSLERIIERFKDTEVISKSPDGRDFSIKIENNGITHFIDRRFWFTEEYKYLITSTKIISPPGQTFIKSKSKTQWANSLDALFIIVRSKIKLK